MKRWSSVAVLGLSVFLAMMQIGCDNRDGGFTVVPVSGTITLDSQPLANAKVRFIPQSASGSPTGPFSSGLTDSSGRYQLKTRNGSEGAVVGQHSVVVEDQNDFRNQSGSDGTDLVNQMKNQQNSPAAEFTAEFEVPSGGTDAANFDLTTEK